MIFDKPNINNKKVRPFLKWAGNKFRTLDLIIPSLPPALRLIEPFTGSAAIFLNTHYSAALLAEKNQDLVVLFQQLQTEGEPFIEYCETYFQPELNIASRYYQFREQFNHEKDARVKSALFLYLNRHGYNGLCRYNHGGGYNVPFGAHQAPYFPRFEMQYFHTKSQNTQFIHKDFREVFRLAQPGDVIYCDPPYVPIKQNSNFSAYTGHKFGEQEQIELVELAMHSAARNIPVIISNHDTDFTRHHYRYGEIKSFFVQRFISCRGQQRTAVKELLAIFQ